MTAEEGAMAEALDRYSGKPPSIAEVRAILAALRAAGWEVVPVDLTTAMHDRGTASMNRDGTIHAIWTAMLAAARG